MARVKRGFKEAIVAPAANCSGVQPKPSIAHLIMHIVTAVFASVISGLSGSPVSTLHHVITASLTAA
jgi:hypothetical protein